MQLPALAVSALLKADQRPWVLSPQPPPCTHHPLVTSAVRRHPEVAKHALAGHLGRRQHLVRAGSLHGTAQQARGSAGALETEAPGGRGGARCAPPALRACPPPCRQSLHGVHAQAATGLAGSAGQGQVAPVARRAGPPPAGLPPPPGGGSPAHRAPGGAWSGWQSAAQSWAPPAPPASRPAGSGGGAARSRGRVGLSRPGQGGWRTRGWRLRTHTLFCAPMPSLATAGLCGRQRAAMLWQVVCTMGAALSKPLPLVSPTGGPLNSPPAGRGPPPSPPPPGPCARTSQCPPSAGTPLPAGRDQAQGRQVRRRQRRGTRKQAVRTGEGERRHGAPVH